jgi:competence protein ComEC
LGKLYLIRLKHSSLYNELLSGWHFICFSLVLFLILVNSKSFFVGLCLAILLFYLSKLNKRFVVLLVILFIIIGSKLLIYEGKYQNRHLGDYYGYGIIEKAKQNDYGKQYVVNLRQGKYVLFLKKDQGDFKIGDRVLLKGTLRDAERAHLPYGFDYQKYLKNLTIYGQIEIEEIAFVEHKFTVKEIKAKIENYYDRSFSKESSTILKALIMGSEDAFSKDLKTQINQIGISHLFVVSGLHVSVFVLILTKLLKIFKVKEKHHFYILTPILFGYLIIMHFMVSIIRVFLSEVLKRVNQQYRLNLTTIDRFCLNIIIVLIINPNYLFQMGFILSYLISGSLIVSSRLLGRFHKQKFRSGLIMCFISLLVSIPVVAWLSPEVNLLSALFNLVYIPFVSFVLLPLSLVVTFLPIFDGVYLGVVRPFLWITKLLSTIKFGVIRFPHPNWLIIALYYGFLINLLSSCERNEFKKARNAFLSFFGVCVFWLNMAWFNPFDKVLFLDLPMGEATLIVSRFNQMNILIDTGEAGYEDVHQLLMKLGIKRIDYLILSHGDSDHAGEAWNIMNRFMVKTLVVSKYDDSIGIQKALSGKRKNTFFLEAGDYLRVKNLFFQVLHPEKPYSSSNNNSLVLFANLFGKSFLFTGDIEKEAESDLVDRFPHIEVDYLKVAHHGSLTSTSVAFLKTAKFSEAVIMSGYRNTFGFPHPLTLKKITVPVWDTKAKQTLVLHRPPFKKILKPAKNKK